MAASPRGGGCCPAIEGSSSRSAPPWLIGAFPFSPRTVRQACDPGVLRFPPVRVDPRWQQRPAHDGANAGDEHAPVRLGQEPLAPQGPAGSPHLPTFEVALFRRVWAQRGGASSFL